MKFIKYAIAFCGLSVFAIQQKHQYYGQFLQDQYVNEKFFKDKKNGVFLDIGAFDGVCGSNTYFFEKELNWHGMCVEPVKNAFNKLIQFRRSININAAVSDVPGIHKFMQITTKEGALHGWSGLSDKYDPIHLQRLKTEWLDKGSHLEVIDVQCYNINDLLNQYKLKKIDYFSLDVEGAEFAILSSLDFNQFDIDIIDVENNYEAPELRKLLESKGFVFVERLGVDDIFRNKKYIRKSE